MPGASNGVDTQSEGDFNQKCTDAWDKAKGHWVQDCQGNTFKLVVGADTTIVFGFKVAVVLGLKFEIALTLDSKFWIGVLPTFEAVYAPPIVKTTKRLGFHVVIAKTETFRLGNYAKKNPQSGVYEKKIHVTGQKWDLYNGNTQAVTKIEQMYTDIKNTCDQLIADMVLVDTKLDQAKTIITTDFNNSMVTYTGKFGTIKTNCDQYKINAEAKLQVLTQTKTDLESKVVTMNGTMVTINGTQMKFGQALKVIGTKLGRTPTALAGDITQLNTDIGQLKTDLVQLKGKATAMKNSAEVVKLAAEALPTP